MNIALTATFQAFSAAHGLSLLVSGLLIAVVVSFGLNAKRRGNEPAATRCLGLIGVALWLAQQAYALLLEFNPYDSFPLHICDIAAIVGPLALLLPHRLLRTVLYFWAFAFTTQGLITPTLERGPATLTFWIFWVNHVSIIGMAVYDMVVRRYRPTPTDLLHIIVFTLGYVAVVAPIDALLDWNYGYLGADTPGRPTLLDVLGPWPWRLVWIILMGAIMLTHAWLPWPIIQWLRQRQPPRAPQSEPG